MCLKLFGIYVCTIAILFFCELGFAGNEKPAKDNKDKPKSNSANKVEEPKLNIPRKLEEANKIVQSAVSVSSIGESSATVGEIASRGPIVGVSTRNDLSLPLRWMPVLQGSVPQSLLEVPNKRLPSKVSSDENTPSKDPVVQDSPFSLDLSVTPNIPATTQNFDGNNNVSGVLPPDTNGDVGPNHYVQTVNLVYSVYNKTGTKLLGPLNINSLWSGFGGPCQTTNNGDPIVVYDQLADRWMISQFALPNYPNGPFYQCIAVSQSGDPTGAFYRYEFQMSTNLMNDYPHFGLWPDGYYMSLNQFQAPGLSYHSAGAVVFERDKMLLGQTARFVKFNQTNEGGQLPSDLDGTTLPPSGSPNYFVDFETNAFHIWKFHVDWVNTANSTFTTFALLNVAAFDATFSCGTSGRDCIPQPGTTEKLDVISDRMMHRAAYRNFGTHQSLVTNHTVDAGTNRAGVRWYEVRNPGNSPSVFQQGTYSPDSNNRWMGSVAMDKNGNMGVGYSVSNTSLFPSIRYTGRLVTDPVGTLPQGEGEIIAGGGSQTHSASRWGDYSSMSIDPSDDCTFWFTSEYLQTTSSASWRTRIGSFKFPSCSGVSCNPPSGLTNNGAVDLDPCADTGVQISWSKDPSNWGDSGGTRTYDVLRDGLAIASNLAYGTTTHIDTSGMNGVSYTYSVRYKNGCGQNVSTGGVQAADNIDVSSAATETAKQVISLRAKNKTVSSLLSPAFTIAAQSADSATLTWILTGATDFTNCVEIRLRAPNGTSEIVVKTIGQANPGNANVLGFYQTHGPGQYTIVLRELVNCGQRTAKINSTQMVVHSPDNCP